MLVRNLLRRRTRTILTLVGIALGIAAIVSLVALSRGIASNYAEVTSRSAADVTLQAVQGEGQALTLGTGFDEALLDRIRAMPDVKSVSGVVFTMVRVPNAPIFIVFGYEPDQVGIRHFRVTEGVSLADTPGRRGGKPILLGKVAAGKLKRGVGDTLHIEETTFRIVGIFETGVAMEDAAAVMSLRDAQILADMPRQVIYVGIQLTRPDRSDGFKVKLARMLPPDVEMAGTQLGNMMLEMFEMLDLFTWAVAMIAALVGGVGMMNSMLMSVFERTREIGVLRALGWRRRHVLSMILGESLLLSLVGGGLGLGIGAALTWLAANTPAMAGLTRDTVPSQLIVQAMSAAVVLGLVGGLYPAWRASRLAPVEALRYDGGSVGGRVIRLPWGGMALQNLVRQKTRTALTLVGVGIAVLAMMLMGSAGDGAIKSFNSLVSGAEITAVEADQPDTSLSSIEDRVLRRIEALPEVHRVDGLIYSVVSTPKSPFLVINARDRSDPTLNSRIVKEGRLLDGRRECLLGWKAASQQGKAVGDRFTFLGSSFTVVGIVETGSALEDNGVIIDLREAQQLLKKPHQVMAAQIKVANPRDVEAVITRLSADYPKLLFSKSAEWSESLPDMEMTRQWIRAIEAMTIVVGSIALMNTLIMSIYERTREIGVLRAVGWRRSRVLVQIMTESLLITLLSGIVGIIASILLVRVIRTSEALGLYRDMFTINASVLLRPLALCVVLGAIGGLYPAWRATRFSPIEALRYE